MNLWRRIIQTYANTRPLRVISHEEQPILKRYFVFQMPKWTGGLRCYLHHFIGDDPDGLHNHPWRFGLSVMLAGWYWDERRWGKTKVKWINRVDGDCFHRVTLPYHTMKRIKGLYDTEICINEVQTSWSLFFHSPRRMRWGFLRNFPEPFASIYPMEQLYELTTKETPTAFSDWHLTAPTGAQWEWLEARRIAKEQHEKAMEQNGGLG